MKILSNKKYEELNERLSMALFDTNLLRCELEVRSKRAEELLIERDNLNSQIKLLKNENELLKEKIISLKMPKIEKKEEVKTKEVKKATRTRRTKKEA